MRLTELEHIGRIRDQYLALRSAGINRTEATLHVIGLFEPKTVEERLTFWVGLADAQYLRKELMFAVAEQGLLALHRLAEDPCITPGDIERRRKHYTQAPMPERKLGRPLKR